jgi:hypothetical protein
VLPIAWVDTGAEILLDEFWQDGAVFRFCVSAADEQRMKAQRAFVIETGQRNYVVLFYDSWPWGGVTGVEARLFR